MAKSKLSRSDAVSCPCCNTPLKRLSWAVYAGSWDYVTHAQGYGLNNQRTCRKCKRTFRIHAKADSKGNVTRLNWSCQEKL